MLVNKLTRATQAIFLLLIIFKQNTSISALSCAKDISNFPVDIQKLSGTWYEVARIPEVDVPACVKVLAPTSLSGDKNNSYALRVNFVNNVNNQWLNTTQTLVFPWTSQGSNGIFELVYGDDVITFTYKIALTDYTSMAVVCGYTSFSTTSSFLKVLSRTRQLSKSMEDNINALAQKYADGIAVGWVEQSSRCNGAALFKPFLVAIFCVFWALIRSS